MLITAAMKFSRHITTRLYSLVSSSKLNLHDLLLKNLAINTQDIDNIIYLHGDKLSGIPPDKIIKNCELLRNLNVELNPVANIAPCLKLHSSVLSHRICLMQEMGVPIVNINLIYRVPIHMKIPANEFKKKSNIPAEQHIMINLLHHIDNKISDSPPLDLLSESLPLFMHFEKCFLHYAMRELGVNDIKLLTRKARKYKSIRLMTRLLKLFREEIGVDQEYLRKHLYILDLCPDETKNMLESLKNIKLGTLTLQEAVKKKPEILQYDPENIKELLQSLKKYEVDDKAVDNCLQGLKLKNRVFVEKMKYFLSLPDIRVWCKNPRILHFILNEKTVRERIDYLRKTGFIKWASVYLITSSKRHFKKFLEDELNFTNKRTYVKYILCKELGSDKVDIIDLLIRHPYWNRVSFVDMDYTLCSLKKNFSTEDICNNIHLILYPWTLITKTLNNIQNSSEQSQKYTTCQLLALCLYWLEKCNHFTGDGVWNLHTDSRKPLKKEKIILRNDVSYGSNKTLDTLNNKKSDTIHA